MSLFFQCKGRWQNNVLGNFEISFSLFRYRLKKSSEFRAKNEKASVTNFLKKNSKIFPK